MSTSSNTNTYSLILASVELARISDLSAASYVQRFLDEDYVGRSARLVLAAYNLTISAEQFVVSARESYNTFAQADIHTVTEYKNSAYSADISASYFTTAAYNADLSAVYFSGLVSAQKNITAADVSSAYRSDLSAANFAILATNAETSSDAWTYYIDASGAYQSAYDSYLHANAAYSLAYTYCYIDTSDSVARALQAYNDAHSAYIKSLDAYTNAQNICNANAGTDISGTLNILLEEISVYESSAFSHSSNALQYYLDASANQFSAAIAAYNDASINVLNALLHANSAENSTTTAYNAYTSKLAAETAFAVADFYTPQPFTSILTQSVPQSYNASLPSLTATSFTTLNRYMIKYGASYLTIDPFFNLVLTSGMDTYSDVLSKVFEAVLDPSDNLTSSSFRIDSDMNNIYSLDFISSDEVLKFSNNWGQAANSTSGFLRFDYLNKNLVVKSRRRITDNSYDYSDDSSFTLTNSYVYYDSGSSRFKLTTNLALAAEFTLYKSPIRADMPSVFNPYSIPYVPNARVSIANYVGPKRTVPGSNPPTTVGAKNTISNMDRNVRTELLTTQYIGQVDVSGWSVNTDISATAMLDTIFTAVQGQGNTIRYDKSVYKAFRTAALQTTLGSHSIADGTLGQNTVPYVYFTNDVSNGVYHPFMVMASYSISDKPNRLLDVCRPPADGDAGGYDANNVTRDATLQNYLVKIPMLDYGRVTTNLTSANTDRNNMLSTLLSEIPDGSPDAAGIDKATPTPYNYASNSAIGVAVDGVVIYPPSNNTLRPAQAQAEITNTGIHIGRGMGLHYHADGQSATPNNNMNLYNTNDYMNHRHPPLIGFGLDGIALYGQYDLSYNTMHGYGIALDGFGGHSHGTYGYHYHAHTVDVSSNEISNKITLGMNTLSGVATGSSSSQAYKLHVLMKGAWAGKINTIPEFWDVTRNAPSFTLGTNNSKFAGYVPATLTYFFEFNDASIPTATAPIIVPIKNSATNTDISCAFLNSSLVSNCLKLTNTNSDYGTLSINSPRIILSFSFSIAFWIHPKTIGTTQTLFYISGTLPQDLIANPSLNTSLRIVQPTSTTSSVTSTRTLTSYAWNHVAFTYSRFENTYTCNCYINGILDTALTNTTISVSGIITDNTEISDYRIGFIDDATIKVAGSLFIDNYRHFTGILSSSQVTSFYNNDGARPLLTDTVSPTNVSKPADGVTAFLNETWVDSGNSATRQTISKTGTNYYDGSYNISASSIADDTLMYSSQHLYKMQMNSSNYYTSGRNKYDNNANNGNYIGSTSTTYNISSSISGEWVQIELPYSLILKSFELFPQTYFYNALPKTFVVLGSINGTDFTLLFSVTNHDYPASLRPGINLDIYSNANFTQTFTVTNNNSQPYRYFRLVINRINNDWFDAGGTYISHSAFAQWNLIGDAVIP